METELVSLILVLCATLHRVLDFAVPRMENHSNAIVRRLAQVLGFVALVLPTVLEPIKRKHATKPPPPPTAPIALVLACSMGLSACAGSRAQNLETARGIIDSANDVILYTHELSRTTCHFVAEWEILRAPDADTAEAIRQDIANHCEPVYQAFEALASTHAAAVRTWHMVEDRQADVGELLDLAGDLAAAILRAREAYLGLREVLSSKYDAPLPSAPPEVLE